jgi:hypothetical protein
MLVHAISKKSVPKAYPSEAEIENFLGREDVVVITDEQLEMADEVARLNSQ